MPEFDERDRELLDRRLAAFNKISEPRVGDFVRFPDGHFERMSYIWPDVIQTSQGGSFYFGLGQDEKGDYAYCSFSGGLNPGIDKSKFKLTDELKAGQIWFFHHDWPQAYNGVYEVDVEFRVYEVAP